MTLGKCNFTDVIYVALIDSDVLLGVDLLNKHKAKIDLLNFNLCFQGFDIPMVFGGQEEDSNIPLFVKNTVRIPPRSIARISCKIKEPLSQFLVEPIYSLRGLIPRSLQKSYEFEFPVVNPTDQNLHCETIPIKSLEKHKKLLRWTLRCVILWKVRRQYKELSYLMIHKFLFTFRTYGLVLLRIETFRNRRSLRIY